MGRGGVPEEQGVQMGAARAADMLSEGKVCAMGSGVAQRAAGRDGAVPQSHEAAQRVRGERRHALADGQPCAAQVLTPRCLPGRCTIRRRS